MKEINRLHFAAVVMSALGVVFVAGMTFYYLDGRSGGSQTGVGEDIFDTCKTILPPIATLVLGYYFGQSDRPKDGMGNESDKR